MKYKELVKFGEYTLNMRPIHTAFTVHFDVQKGNDDMAEIFLVIGEDTDDSMLYVFWNKDYVWDYAQSKKERENILDMLEMHIDKIKETLGVDFPIRSHERMYDYFKK